MRGMVLLRLKVIDSSFVKPISSENFVLLGSAVSLLVLGIILGLLMTLLKTLKKLCLKWLEIQKITGMDLSG